MIIGVCRRQINYVYLFEINLFFVIYHVHTTIFPTFHCLLNLECRHKLVSQPERTSPTVIMYPASSGFSRPDGTLLWKEINHCEQTFASLIKPPSFTINEWINFKPVKTVLKKVKTRALVYAYKCCVSASLLWICAFSVFIAIFPTYFLCQRLVNPTGVGFLGTISNFRKKNKISSLLIYVLHKKKGIFALWSCKNGTEMYKKCNAHSRLLFCLLNLLFCCRSRCSRVVEIWSPLMFFCKTRKMTSFSVGVTWTRMLNGEANGRSHWVFSLGVT